MLVNGRRIALFCGIGIIGKVLSAGVDAITLTETKNETHSFDIDVLKLTDYQDYSSLLKAYKKV